MQHEYYRHDPSAFTTAGPGTESNDIFETPNYGIRTTSKVNIASQSDDVAMFSQ